MKKLLILLCLIFMFMIGCSKEENQAPTSNNTSPVTENNVTDIIEEEPAQAEVSTDIRVLADALNVRRSYSLDSDVIGLIKKDSIHELLEVYDGQNGQEWYKIQTEDYTGWVAGWYCMNNDAYQNKVLAGNLLPAYEGKIPSAKGTFGSTYKDIEALYDGQLEMTNYWGSPGLYNEKILYQFGDDGLSFISVSPETTIYGLAPKTTLEEAQVILGDPNLQTRIDDPEGHGVYEDGSIVLSYITGSYLVKFVFDENQELSRVELSKHIL